MYPSPISSHITSLILISSYNFQIGGKPGGSCTAALFLKKFVKGVEPSEETSEPEVRWAHIDIAGTMEVRHNRVCQIPIISRY